MLRKIKGFTLIELLIVIVIIAILASIAIPACNRALNKAKQQQTSAVPLNPEKHKEDKKSEPSMKNIDNPKADENMDKL